MTSASNDDNAAEVTVNPWGQRQLVTVPRQSPPCAAAATAVALVTLPVTRARLKEPGVEVAPDDNEEGRGGRVTSVGLDSEHPWSIKFDRIYLVFFI